MQIKIFYKTKEDKVFKRVIESQKKEKIYERKIKENDSVIWEKVRRRETLSYIETKNWEIKTMFPVFICEEVKATKIKIILEEKNDLQN